MTHSPGVDQRWAKRSARGWKNHGSAERRYIVHASDDAIGNLARAYLALLDTLATVPQSPPNTGGLLGQEQ